MARRNLRRASYQRYAERPERTRNVANDILALAVVTLIIVALLFIFIRASADKRAEIAAEDSETIIEKLNELDADVQEAPAQNQFTYYPGCVMVDTGGNPVPIYNDPDSDGAPKSIWKSNWYRCVGACTIPDGGEGGSDVNALCKP